MSKSLVFIAIGFLLTFLGFVYPGWAWVLSTSGDTEMLSLLVASVVGITGIVLIITGVVLSIAGQMRKKAASKNENDFEGAA